MSIMPPNKLISKGAALKPHRAQHRVTLGQEQHRANRIQWVEVDVLCWNICKVLKNTTNKHSLR